MAGTAFGRYRIIRELGRGAMAVVYLAEDGSLMREVAIKSLLPQYAADTAFHERFLREGRILARVRNQSIVPIYDFGSEDGVPYLVMEYMPGGTLEERVRSGHLSLDESLEVLTRVASALDAAHTAGIIHRDLKPANILFDSEDRAFVGDFGVGRMAGGSGVTQPGTVIGTAHYMSPEQVNGAPPTAAADIYSFGALVYETLTGHAPFRGDSVWDIMRKHVEERPVPPSAINPALGFADAPILAALSKNPAERPERAAAIASELAAGYGRRTNIAAPTPTPPTVATSTPRPVRRRSIRPAILAGVAAALVAGAAVAAAALLLDDDEDDGVTPTATETEGTTATEEASETPDDGATASPTEADETETAVPTLEPSGNVVLFENFDDPANIQVAQPTGLAGRGFAAEGAYGVDDVSADDNFYIAVEIEAPGRDHSIGIDAFSPEGGSVILTCRGDSQFDVRLVARPALREYRVEVLDRNEARFTVLTTARETDLIDPAEGNRYLLVCVGDSVKAGINGVLVAEHTLPGFEGTRVSFGADGGVRSVFDNLEVRSQ